MLDRIWLILIFVLAGLVGPMNAARGGGPADVALACDMACCAGGCECAACECAISDPGPVEREPAVPLQPEREQKRQAEPFPGLTGLVGDERPAACRAPALRSAAEARWPSCVRLESVFCVWRI
jgi:hypothetical protein